MRKRTAFLQEPIQKHTHTNLVCTRTTLASTRSYVLRLFHTHAIPKTSKTSCSGHNPWKQCSPSECETYCVSTRKKKNKHTQKNKTSYSQNRIHQKLVAPFSTKTYCVPTKNNTKPHGHKSRLNKGDPCEYVRSYVLRLFHTHEKNKTHSHKNRLKEGRPLRVRDRTYYDCFTLMPFRRDPKRAVLRTEFINNGSPCEYEKGVRSYKQNKTHANFV